MHQQFLLDYCQKKLKSVQFAKRIGILFYFQKEKEINCILKVAASIG